jgi:cystathionine beta-lyase/cystathionine gamma-synthase
MRIETLAVHAGHAPDASTGAVTPPIHLSTTFEREADGQYRAGLVYSRYANPNRTALEECLAMLEGGAGAACFASGSSATAAVLQSLEAGAHVIAPDDAYFGTTKLMRDIFAPSGRRSAHRRGSSGSRRHQIRYCASSTSRAWQRSRTLIRRSASSTTHGPRQSSNSLSR